MHKNRIIDYINKIYLKILKSKLEEIIIDNDYNSDYLINNLFSL